MLYRAAVLAVGVALSSLLAGCQIGPRPLPGAEYLPAGEWAVVAVRPGPIGVRDPADAMARFGQMIRYAPDRVVSGGEACDYPSYVVHAIQANHYLRYETGFTAADLGLYRWQDVRLAEVYCNGRKWPGLGGEVFWVDPDRAFAVRDDALYELRRAGAEPAR